MNTDPPTSNCRCTSRSAFERLAAETANNAAPSTAARSSKKVSAIRLRSGKSGHSGQSATVSGLGSSVTVSASAMDEAPTSISLAGTAEASAGFQTRIL